MPLSHASRLGSGRVYHVPRPPPLRAPILRLGQARRRSAAQPHRRSAVGRIQYRPLPNSALDQLIHINAIDALIREREGSVSSGLHHTITTPDNFDQQFTPILEGSNSRLFQVGIKLGGLEAQFMQHYAIYLPQGDQSVMSRWLVETLMLPQMPVPPSDAKKKFLTPVGAFTPKYYTLITIKSMAVDIPETNMLMYILDDPLDSRDIGCYLGQSFVRKMRQGDPSWNFPAPPGHLRGLSHDPSLYEASECFYESRRPFHVISFKGTSQELTNCRE